MHELDLLNGEKDGAKYRTELSIVKFPPKPRLVEQLSCSWRRKDRVGLRTQKIDATGE
jgi:hypothetical protein